MKGYNSYKNSGVESIGEVPKEWNVRKLKYLAKIKNGKDQKEVLIEEGGYPVLGTGGEFGRASTFLYDKPSVLLGRKGTIDKPFYIEEPFWTVDTLFYTEIYENTIPKFLFYLTKTIRFEFYQESSAVPSMTQDNLNNIKLCHPSIEEQTSIASFLDYKTNLIDETIEKKKRLIALLKEKRQAVINEAVTKGLNPTATMKDSGVEWLGEIPEHWKVKSLKHVVSCNDDTLNDKTDKDLEINYIEIGDVSLEKGIENYTKMKFSEAPSRARRIVKENDIILSTVRTYLKAITKVNSNYDNFIASTGFAVLRSKFINPDFLGAIVKTENFIDEVISLSVGVSYPAINSSILLDISIPLPPEDEQLMISDKIDKEFISFQNLISKIEVAIEKLQTYRQSLISEAVTGKIDVRDWEITKN